MNPDKIVEELNIRNGMAVADFGCGAGYFTIPIARIIKNSGIIYAIDVLTSALEDVLSKAKLYGLLNIKTVRANIETVGGSKIKSTLKNPKSKIAIAIRSPIPAPIIPPRWLVYISVSFSKSIL